MGVVGRREGESAVVAAERGFMDWGYWNEYLDGVVSGQILA